MALLVITHRQKKLEPRLPYQIFLNGQLVCFMTAPQIQIQLPEGMYNLSVRIGAGLPIGRKRKVIDLSLSSSTAIHVCSPYTCLEFKNKERWWDILFSIDLIFWFITFFFTIPTPWNIVYHVLSDGFFLAWLIRLIVVRRRYFALSYYSSLTVPQVLSQGGDSQ